MKVPGFKALRAESSEDLGKISDLFDLPSPNDANVTAAVESNITKVANFLLMVLKRMERVRFILYKSNYKN